MTTSLDKFIASKVLNAGSFNLDVKAAVSWSSPSDAEYEEAMQLLEDWNRVYFESDKYKNDPHDVTTSWFIDVTGRQHEFFTLWTYHYKAKFAKKPVTFRGNLSKNLLTAVKKFVETHEPGHTYVSLDDVEVAAWDPQVFKFGKHRGENILQVFKEDPRYITWFANKFEPERPSRGLEAQIRLCKELSNAYYGELISHNENTVESHFYEGTHVENAEVTISSIQYSEFKQYGVLTHMVTVYGQTPDNHYVHFQVTGNTALALRSAQKGDTFKIIKAGIKKTFTRLGINYTSLYRMKVAA